MLLTIPLARQVSRGLAPNYDNPYGLMAVMGVNIKLHLYAGVLLFAAYVIVLILGAVAPSVPAVPVAAALEPPCPRRSGAGAGHVTLADLGVDGPSGGRDACPPRRFTRQAVPGVRRAR